MKRVVNPFLVPCPYCAAPALSKCRDHKGRAVKPHERRKVDAAKTRG